MNNTNDAKFNVTDLSSSITFIFEINADFNSFSLRKKDTDLYLLASSTSNPIIGTKTENELFHHWAFYKPDRTAPIITLNGDSFINIDQYDTYEEQGAIAVDDIDGPVDVIITGQVNTNVPKYIYSIIYCD